VRFRSLSIVLPAYNEAANVADTIRATLGALDECADVGEVVVVDDGSADDTGRIAEALGDARVRVVRHPENRGYGAALRSGFGVARGEHVFFTDADLQFDVREISRLAAWSDTYDIVVGYRHPRSDPWIRRFNGWSWSRLMNGLFEVHVRDVGCAFKVFHRRVLERVPLVSLGAFVNSELLVRAQAAGFRIHEVPVSHYPRRAGAATGANPRVIGRAWWELGVLYRELKAEQRRRTGLRAAMDSPGTRSAASQALAP
jgi:glycosyltransferase involved in cell wall biosynthesis